MFDKTSFLGRLLVRTGARLHSAPVTRLDKSAASFSAACSPEQKHAFIQSPVLAQTKVQPHSVPQFNPEKVELKGKLFLFLKKLA